MSDFIQVRGLCENRGRHAAHVFPTGAHVTPRRSMQECPGVYVDCLNCDDRKCMDCVLRYMHDRCEDSCPDCCNE